MMGCALLCCVQVTFLAIMGTAYGGSALAFAALGLMLGAQGRHRQAASDEEEEAPLLRRETHTRTRQRDTFV
jgi:cephalosporin hydroxylase